MKIKKSRNIKLFLVVALITLVIATIISGCSGDNGTISGGEARESSHSESSGEGAGEHGSGSSEGGGEAAEAGHNEAGGGDGNEGSGANSLPLDATYDVTRNGGRLVLAYDTPSNSFVGFVENTSSQTLTQARVEIHLSNGTELGPTPRTDLAPGEILDIILPATSNAFYTWSPHVEFGSGEGCGESSSEHGSGGESGEASGHAEGGEGGGEGGMEALMSSPGTPISQTWSGNLGGLEVTGYYDENAKTFTSIVTNPLPYQLCYVQTEPHMKMSANTVGELGPDMLGNLNPGQTVTSVIYLANDSRMTGVNFDGFSIHLEVFDCEGPGPDGGAPTINPLTGQPGGGEGEAEGGGEGSEDGEEGGHNEGGGG